MALIEWKDEFNLGVPSIDHEHRELINLINESFDHLVGSDSHKVIQHYLGEIYAKIAAHFALEEKIMRDKKYDQYEDHKQDHEQLLDDILDIMDEYDEQDIVDCQKLGDSLTYWFTNHFKTKDARLHKRLGI
jgi:hemerythrin